MYAQWHSKAYENVRKVLYIILLSSDKRNSHAYGPYWPCFQSPFSIMADLCHFVNSLFRGGGEKTQNSVFSSFRLRHEKTKRKIASFRLRPEITKRRNVVASFRLFAFSTLLRNNENTQRICVFSLFRGEVEKTQLCVFVISWRSRKDFAASIIKLWIRLCWNLFSTVLKYTKLCLLNCSGKIYLST